MNPHTDLKEHSTGAELNSLVGLKGSGENILASQKKVFRSGYASLIGRPNVGKSTLINKLVAQKIAAMSRRPQTTRNKITGICHLPGGQIILLDTPGIHKGATMLDKAMVKTSMQTYGDVDLILFMIDARKGFCDDDKFVLDSMRKVTAPKLLIINKVDLVAKKDLLGLIAEMSASGTFAEIIPISALKSDGLDMLKDIVLKRLPEGPEYFPKDMVTDCPEEFLTGEIIREKIIKLTHLEIPDAVAVMFALDEQVPPLPLGLDVPVSEGSQAVHLWRWSADAHFRAQAGRDCTADDD